ncbi:hypothetical protein YC2023_049130 [Brassica napus]
MDNCGSTGRWTVGSATVELRRGKHFSISFSCNKQLPTHAALLAIRMLGISVTDLVSRMSQYREDMREENMVKGEKLEREVLTEGSESILELLSQVVSV